MNAVVRVEYDGRPHGLTFVVGDRRLQLVHLRNGFAEEQRVMFKIQSTSTRKFRVRPMLGALAPQESITVQIQLAPQEKEPSECKFLIAVRRVDPLAIASRDDTSVVVARSSGSSGGDRAPQDKVDEDKAMWQRAEACHEQSLVYTETIFAKIVLCQSGDGGIVAEVPSATSLPPQPERRPTNEQHPPVLALGSVEAQAHIVVLLIKNQSKKPQNKLTKEQLESLVNLRERDADEWMKLVGYARRMRTLARQYQRQ